MNPIHGNFYVVDGRAAFYDDGSDGGPPPLGAKFPLWRTLGLFRLRKPRGLRMEQNTEAYFLNGFAIGPTGNDQAIRLGRVHQTALDDDELVDVKLND